MGTEKMAEKGVRGVNVLQDELKRAKERLKNVDQSIKKITGRDPGEARPAVGRGGVGPGGMRRGGPPIGMRGRGGAGPASRIFNVARMGLGSPKGPPLRRLSGGPTPGRPGLSPRGRRRPEEEEEEEPNRTGLQSKVAAAETRTRTQTVEVMATDKKAKQRN